MFFKRLRHLRHLWKLNNFPWGTRYHIQTINSQGCYTFTGDKIIKNETVERSENCFFGFRTPVLLRVCIVCFVTGAGILGITCLKEEEAEVKIEGRVFVDEIDWAGKKPGSPSRIDLSIGAGSSVSKNRHFRRSRKKSVTSRTVIKGLREMIWLSNIRLELQN